MSEIKLSNLEMHIWVVKLLQIKHKELITTEVQPRSGYLWEKRGVCDWGGTHGRGLWG